MNTQHPPHDRPRTHHPARAAPAVAALAGAAALADATPGAHAAAILQLDTVSDIVSASTGATGSLAGVTDDDTLTLDIGFDLDAADIDFPDDGLAEYGFAAMQPGSELIITTGDSPVVFPLDGVPASVGIADDYEFDGGFRLSEWRVNFSVPDPAGGDVFDVELYLIYDNDPWDDNGIVQDPEIASAWFAAVDIANADTGDAALFADLTSFELTLIPAPGPAAGAAALALLSARRRRR